MTKEQLIEKMNKMVFKNWKDVKKNINFLDKNGADSLSVTILLNNLESIVTGLEIAKKFVAKKGKLNKKELDKPFVKEIIKNKFKTPTQLSNLLRNTKNSVFLYHVDCDKNFNKWFTSLLKDIKDLGKQAKEYKKTIAQVTASIKMLKDILNDNKER